MSDTNTNPKPPLWKQLLGALAGAMIAVVLYQAYMFTSSHLQAMNQSLRLGSWQATVRSVVTQGSSTSSSASSVDDYSSVAVEESTPEVIDLPPEEPVHEAADPIVAGVPEHSGQLPQSGFGLDLLAFTALGAVMGSRRMRRK